MTHIFAWLGLVGGIVSYRLLGTSIPIEEHIAGAYFSAWALGIHFALTKAWSMK